MVSGDTVYLCTSHDEDVTVGGFFTMNDWRLFSSQDMVNWTDRGTPLRYQTFSWATGKAWAPHCVERNGKFYMFVPVSDAIGVAVADSPLGPFEDAIGRPLVSNYQYIDPTVYIDGDGQAYLYFGNPKLWYVKLNEDMTSYSGQIQEVDQTQGFGQRSGDEDRPTLYEEGPWFYKRNDAYYMLFASGPLPETIGYSMSSSATGPWSYKGVIMANQSGHAFTNHSGVIDFKGRSFFFYHTQELPGGDGYKRSVALEEFTYNQDGTIPTINKTAQGVIEPVQPLDPYSRVEGETIAWGSGVEVEDCSAGGRDVSNIENGDSIKVKSVDFGTGALGFEASVASAGSGGKIDLHLDSASGTLLGTCDVPGTGGWQTWQTVSCDVDEVTGVHDLFLVFTGGSGSLFNLDYWQFSPKDVVPTPTMTSPMGSTAPAGSSGPPDGGATAGSASVDIPVGSSSTPASTVAQPSASVVNSAVGTTSTVPSPVMSSAAPSVSAGNGAPSSSVTAPPASSGILPPVGQVSSGCECATRERSPGAPHGLLTALALGVGFATRRRLSRRAGSVRR